MKKLLSENHKLANEWHPSKNGELTPKDFTYGSDKKVWWKCAEGEDHEWEARIYKRSKGNNCPFCSGNKISKTNNLLALNPELSSEWHPTKNKELKPEDYVAGAEKKVWWKCSKGEDHEWEARINSRNRGVGCPYCAGKKISKTNNLLALNPELASEWHPTKNKELKPEEFTAGSGKKIWWQCLRAKDHEWQATINNRVKGSNCPICSGSGTSSPEIRILCELKHLFGDNEVSWRNRVNGIEIDIFLSKLNIGIEYDGYYWHKNKIKSDKKKIKLLNLKNIQLIRLREKPLKALSKNDILHNGNLSKFFLNDLIIKIKSLSPTLLKYDFNDYIKKSDFINEVEFKRFISFLPSPPPEYSFLNSHPLPAKQWHFKKNKPLRPENFSFGSEKIVWWKCHKGEDHEWKSSIVNRSKGNGCPYCSGRKASKTNNLKVLNPDLASEWHPTKNGDLSPESTTLKSNKKVWWKCPNGDDHEWKSSVANRAIVNCPFCSGRKASKTNNLKVLNAKLASEWHPKLNQELSPENFTIHSEKIVWWKCHKGEDHEWKSSIVNRSKGNGCPYCSGRKASKTNNLKVLNPDLASEWHPTKNGDLKPEEFSNKSGKKAWWKCHKGEDHEWEARIYSRSKGNGCPFCGKFRASKDNNLLVLNPKLASEWHPTKNGDLRPENFRSKSNKKVWWQCSEVDYHEWEAVIANRNRVIGNSCPFCSGKRAV